MCYVITELMQTKIVLEEEKKKVLPVNITDKFLH